jgi:hypothetical protein
VDLVVLLSKINDRGWEAAKRTLAAMLIALDEQS